LKIIKNNLRFDNFFYKAYADDLVIIVKHKDLPRSIKEIQQVSEKFNLKFNALKSYWIRANNTSVKSLKETLYVEESLSYKYLGIVID